MNYYEKIKIKELVNVRPAVNFVWLSALVAIIPFFIHIQWFTGPIINAILILTLFMVGIRGALFIAMIPSIMALAGGLLPAVLAPVVPFIMLSNVIYILSIDWVYRIKKSQQGYWSGVIVGSLLKFLFLFLTTGIITELLIKKELAIKVVQMMSWPQFATALMGGMIAWIFLYQRIDKA